MKVYCKKQDWSEVVLEIPGAEYPVFLSAEGAEALANELLNVAQEARELRLQLEKEKVN